MYSKFEKRSLLQ